MIPAWKSQHACSKIQHTNASERYANPGHQCYSRPPSRSRQASSYGAPCQPSRSAPLLLLCFVSSIPSFVWCLLILWQFAPECEALRAVLLQSLKMPGNKHICPGFQQLHQLVSNYLHSAFLLIQSKSSLRDYCKVCGNYFKHNLLKSAITCLMLLILTKMAGWFYSQSIRFAAYSCRLFVCFTSRDQWYVAGSWEGFAETLAHEITHNFEFVLPHWTS